MSRWIDKSRVKGYGSTVALREKLFVLRYRGVSGILGVAVKCVDIKRIIRGESGSLAMV